VETIAAGDVDRLREAVGAFPWIVAALSALRLLAALVRLKTTHYAASSQRLVVEHGIFATLNVPFELHRLGNAVITKPLLLRPFGISNMTILPPGISLVGLRNSAYVRDLLRTGGQLEAQRVDKIRWR